MTAESPPLPLAGHLNITRHLGMTSSIQTPSAGVQTPFLALQEV